MNLINSILPVLCLCVGFYFGYKIKNNNQEIIPEVIKHPRRYVKSKIEEKKQIKEAQKEIDYLNDVMYNIEVYDGTGKGQKTVKRGVNG